MLLNSELESLMDLLPQPSTYPMSLVNMMPTVCSFMVSDFTLSEMTEVKDSTYTETTVQVVALQVLAVAHSPLWLLLKDLAQ